MRRWLGRNEARHSSHSSGGWSLQLLVCDLESVPHCQQLICILDWFHIAKQFQNVRSAVDEAYIETLGGQMDLMAWLTAEALSKLESLTMNVQTH